MVDNLKEHRKVIKALAETSVPESNTPILLNTSYQDSPEANILFQPKEDKDFTQYLARRVQSLVNAVYIDKRLVLLIDGINPLSGV